MSSALLAWPVTYLAPGGDTCQMCAAVHSAMLPALHRLTRVNRVARQLLRCCGANSSTTCRLCPLGTFSSTLMPQAATLADVCCWLFGNVTGASSIDMCQPCPLGSAASCWCQNSSATCQLCIAGGKPQPRRTVRGLLLLLSTWPLQQHHGGHVIRYMSVMSTRYLSANGRRFVDCSVSSVSRRHLLAHNRNFSLSLLMYELSNRYIRQRFRRRFKRDVSTLSARQLRRRCGSEQLRCMRAVSCWLVLRQRG